MRFSCVSLLLYVLRTLLGSARLCSRPRRRVLAKPKLFIEPFEEEKVLELALCYYVLLRYEGAPHFRGIGIDHAEIYNIKQYCRAKEYGCNSEYFVKLGQLMLGVPCARLPTEAFLESSTPRICIELRMSINFDAMSGMVRYASETMVQTL